MPTTAPEVRPWSREHTGEAVARIGLRPLGSGSGLLPADIAALIDASVSVVGASGVVCGTRDGFDGHLLIEPITSGGWSGTWWTHLHSWTAHTAAQVRAMWAYASQPAFDAGAREFYVTVPAADPLLAAWHSLSFGVQHVVATLPSAALARWPAQRQGGILGVELAEPHSDDAPSLALLEMLLSEALRAAPVFSPVPAASWDEATDEWLDTISDDDYILTVARVGGNVVGFALACSTEKSSLHSGLLGIPGSATLAQVNVAPQWRGRGLGSALAMSVVRQALARGFTSVVTDWRSTNIAADAAWRSLGFQPTAYRLQRVIGPHG